MSDDAFWLSFTNLFFLVPFVEAIRKGRFTRAFIYLVLVGASGVYHACYSSYMVCWLPPAIHQHLDFFLSYLLIPLTTLYFIDFQPKYAFIERWLILSYALTIFILRVQVPFEHHSAVEYGLIGSSLGILAIYWLFYAEQHGGSFPPYNWGYVFVGLFFVLFSLAFFLWPDTFGGYGASHSIWHVMAALGQFFILRIKKAAPIYAAMDAPMRVASSIARPRIALGV